MKKAEVQITTIIGKDAEFTGDFSSKGSIRVDGVINGNVTVAGTLIVGASGRINGDVDSQAVVVGGEVVGDIHSPERTELTSTARVFGDITTNTIIIDEKAIFQGGCNMNQEASDKRPRPSGKALRADGRLAKTAISNALQEDQVQLTMEELEE